MFDFVVSPFILGCFFTLILTPLSIYLAKRYGLIDDPVKHRHPAIVHTKPIPRAGGFSIFVAIVLSSLIFFGVFNQTLNAILIAGLVVVLVGLADDKYDLSPYVRFFMNIVCASFLVFSGVRIPFVTNPLGGIFHFDSPIILFDMAFFIPLPEIFAVIWIVWVMNMLNWSKGVDGQMPGVAAIASFVIGIASIRFGGFSETSYFSAIMSFIISGAAVGFLFYNFYPARIFPGYSATILGFLIGVFSILSGVKLATAILVMGIPSADALFTILRRILARRSPFWHDKGHLHHLLLALGFSHSQIALFYWFLSFFLGSIALSLSSKGKLFAIILVIILVSAFIVTLRFLLKLGVSKDGRS